MPNPEDFITFPQYIIQTMYTPGENMQHLVERVIANVWADTPDCAHVFELQYVPHLNGWQGVWIAMIASDWDQWLLHNDRRLQHVIEDTIQQLEAEANREGTDD